MQCRKLLGVGLIGLMTGVLGACHRENKMNADQSATITNVDAKNNNLTVKMKDKNGKEAEKTYKLTEEVRYVDTTGRVGGLDVFQSGDDVIVVEADGRLKEVRHAGKGAVAGNKKDASPTITPTAGKVDREFLNAAAEIDMAEMKIGRLAQERAAASSIKTFGQRLADDHTKMENELQKIAKNHGVALPEKLDSKHQELFDKLSNVKGAEFDKEFSKDMVAGHEKAIKTFEAAAKSDHDTEVKSWAEKWLPTLREHLKMAQSAAKEMDASR